MPPLFAQLYTRALSSYPGDASSGAEEPNIEVVRPSQQRRGSAPPSPEPPEQNPWESWLPRLREWGRKKFKQLNPQHAAVALGVLLLFLAWWWFMPIWTAQTAMDAMTRGQQAEFEDHANRQQLLTSFFDDWMEYSSQTIEPEERTPRALALSVKERLMERMERLYLQHMQQARSRQEWALANIEIDVGWDQRFFAPGREVRLTLRNANGQQQAGWLQLERKGLSWKIVGIEEAIPLLNFALDH